MRILITGADGFVGRALGQHLVDRGFEVTGTVRQLPAEGSCLFPLVETGPIETFSGWDAIFAGKDAIVHLAARVHQAEDGTFDPYEKINVGATGDLTRAAVRQGVARIVFLSSVKVLGEESLHPFTESDRPNPADAYGASKLEAERKLGEIAAGSELEIVILRPPIIYGPSVKANFLKLIHLVEKEIPLPFAKISNQRSMLFLGNLVSAIEICLMHPAAAGQTFFVADAETVSTPALIKGIASELNVRARLWGVPVALLQFLARLIGRAEEMKRLTSSLVVSTNRIQRSLGWIPPFSLCEGLRQTLLWYRYKKDT